MNNNDKHEMHLLTDYCIHCGNKLVDIKEQDLQCFRSNNVTAISHIRSQQRMEYFNVIRTPSKSNNPNSK